ncbi:Protein unc-13 B [Parelaphostrongylus tenuis]|uniref:Protein unc-13 B n=1 Tax=Parelaphostrongylus tenuis TaxID=148309 RepID=A0AAD5R8V6_PARTN|nr:Protein unc-13 B [Parelaphostrongylus tenuis]
MAKWLQIDQELETRNGQTVGTSKPTGHNVLVDVRFELPYGESVLLCISFLFISC